MSTIETKSTISIEDPIKRTISETKDNAKEIEDGELPEEGEITDDDEVESKNQQQAENNKPQPETATTQQSQKQQNERRNDYHSKSSGRDSGTWRKSFSGHHQSFGRNKFTTPNRGSGNDGGGRYRDFDGRIAMKTNAQQEEEMFDSWIRGANRKNRATHSSPNRGDISPIRTTPMLESTSMSLSHEIKIEAITQESGSFLKDGEHDKHEAEMTAAAAPLDDDMDFRGADVNSSAEHKEGQEPGPTEAIVSDDVDFRRSALTHPTGQPTAPPQPPFGNHSPPQFSTSPPRQFGTDRRRPHSQSPPIRFGNDQQKHHEQELYGGSAAKRNRPFFQPEEQRESTPSGPFGGEEGYDNGSGFTTGGGPFEGESRPFQQHGEMGGVAWSQGRGSGFQYFNQRGGRGGGTMGWGYRGGRPFFPRLICKFFREGFCRDAEKCTFSHATADSHRPPQLCKYYQTGFCKKALFCQLMHGEWPCKAFHKGECTKEPCMFSHEPLDDVSRQIVEKMMEDERLGINAEQQQQQQQGTPHQFHNNFRGGHHQPGGFYRPRFHQQQQGQSFSQQHHHRFQHPSQQNQSPNPPFHPQHQQNSGGIINFPPPPPPATEQQHQPSFGQLQQQYIPTERGQQPHSQSSSFNPEYQHGFGTSAPPIPPPGLVTPMLAGTSTTISQQQTQPQPGFGFFNHSGGVNAQQSPLHPHMQPPTTSSTTIALQHQFQQQPSFQQLQQQVQQQAITPHFPHQPSLLLLGPTLPGASPAGNIQQQQIISESPNKQQEFGGQSMAISQDSALTFEQQSCDKKKEDEKSESTSGGFNINQMLEQITRKQSSPPSSPNTKNATIAFVDPTLDLMAGMGLSELLADDESPASPMVSGIEQTQSDTAALIPTVSCEWKLHLVDIPPPSDPNHHFDMKFIQQISSSNSDPRLRRLAEKQFDLVSKTLEKQQQMANTSQQQKHESGKEGINDSIANELLTKVKKESSETSKNPVADPRKDPRRKMKENEKTGKESTSIYNTQVTYKKSNKSTSNQLTKSESFCEEQQSCQSPKLMGDVISENNPTTSTQLSSAVINEEMVQRQMSVLMTAALGHHPSPMGLGQPPNFSTPPPGMIQPHQQIPQLPPQSMSMLPNPGQFYTTPPPFIPQIPSVALYSSNQPITQTQPNSANIQSLSGSQIPASHQPHIPPQQMLGAHAFNLGGSNMGVTTMMANTSPPTSSMTGSAGGSGYHRGNHNGGSGNGGRRKTHNLQQPESPKLQQQLSQQEQNTETAQSPQQRLPPPTMSLREKRKNNEYDSPLARLASSSSGNRQ